MLKGENMTRPVRIAIVGVIVSSLALPVGWAKADPDTKIADRFEVSFRRARRGSSTWITLSDGRHELVRVHRELECDVGIADPNLVLGISHKGVVVQLEDDKGEIIDAFNQESPRLTNIPRPYGPLRYRPRFVVPPKPAKWKTAIRSFLRLPPLKRSRREVIDELQPSRMAIAFDADLLGPDCDKIRRVKGYFHVLMAESLEHIDIPFEPTEGWVRVTSGFEIKVLEAQSTKRIYKYRIEARPEVRAIGAWFVPTDLPARLPVDRLFIRQDGKPARDGLSRRLQAFGGGGGIGGGMSPGLIEKIRFVIAVNPSHQKIPFVLEDIPLPSLEAPEPPRRASPVPGRAPRARRRAQLVPYAPTGPLSKTILRQTRTKLSWESRSGAASYDVYMGESFEDVNDGVNGTFQGNQNATFFIVGLSLPGRLKTSFPDGPKISFPDGPKMSYPDGLVPGKTYYWRVDQVNSKTNSRRKGEVRSFSIAPRAAFNPFPADGAKSVDPNVTLRWVEGLGAKLHTVYFGDDLETVTNATDGPPQSTKTFTRGPLVPGTTYYWRVDEFDGRDTYKGKVWSFTVDDTAESRQVKD
jgi:hypothetical protein